ncbi:ellis-van Creveld syndrome protein isoform X2 [Oryzias melastigma]|uniref:EvC ciliary complex subunit 1 n=1 Tax=Oryzias melastigma TaxID=30732 RepID=A0A3B3CAY2_ORYME|nr:ellis-van Creveld syndrome protein isoform X2 [Oryzias melastigma]
MTVGERAAECDADVLVSFGESLQVYAGLLTVATVCGGLCGVLAASLLYVLCVKPLLLTKQGYNARRLLEPDDGELDHNPSDTKEAASLTNNDKDKQQQPPMNSDVTAFASRAKVVYPINQKYRPLADGASNPSLHEHSKLPPVADDEESSSSSDGESLSQEQDNDDSSQFISSSLVPKSLQNQTFIRVSHYPQTLTQTCFEGRISLYCLALQHVQHFSSQLQEDKYVIFLQLLKKIFTSRFPKDQNDANFTNNILQMKEKELNDLRKQSPASQTLSKESFDVPCSLEEIERAQKDLLEHGLEMSKEFSRQVESVCHLLLKSTSFYSPEEAQSTVASVIQTLLLVENIHMKTQKADLKRIQEKVLWWEELRSFAQSQPALLRWENTLRHGLIAGLLEQLTRDGVLEFSLMETMVSEIHAALSECLQRCTEECKRKTENLVNEKCSKKESKMKKLQRSHTKEKSRVLEGEPAPCDLQELTELYLNMLTKHRQQVCELELQQDHRVSEALFDLWRKLRTCWSKRLAEAARDVFLTSLPAQTSLSAERCEEMWLDLGQELAAQLQQAEGAARRQLLDIQAELKQDEQVWDDGVATVRGCLSHLGERQMKILHRMVTRQSYMLSSEMGKLIERKHEHLLVVVQRYFLARHVCLQMLKEMRLSKLKALSQNDFRALLVEEPSKGWPGVNPPHKSSAASLADRHLGPESQLLENSHQQEFLSELETAAELLQSHAQLVLGNALSYAIHQSMEAAARASQTAAKQDNSSKHHLTESSAQSVYLTKDSLTALVQNYYSRLKDISRKLNPFNTNHEMSGRQEGSSQLRRDMLRELEIWGKKPASAEFQQRVELNKRKLLEQSDVDQEMLFQVIRQKKVALEERIDMIKTQLMEEEESFMTELAALARVSIHAPAVEHSSEEDSSGDLCPPPVLDLLALNPALDPALNPSLTPTYVAPAAKSKPKKMREREARVS